MSNREVQTLEVGLTTEQIIDAIKRMKKNERQEFIEDLLAATFRHCPQSVAVAPISQQHPILVPQLEKHHISSSDGCFNK